ncbi:27211_t:CDS:2, partial [Gigaspora margarita]
TALPSSTTDPNKETKLTTTNTFPTSKTPLLPDVAAEKTNNNKATTLPSSTTDPNKETKLTTTNTFPPSKTAATPFLPDVAAEKTTTTNTKLNEAATSPPSKIKTTSSLTEDAKNEATTLPPSTTNPNKKVKLTTLPPMTTTTPFSPDLAAEKTLNKGSTLNTKTKLTTTTLPSSMINPNKKMKLTESATLSPSMTTTPSSTEDSKKNLYEPTTIPQKNETKTTNSQTPAAKNTDATTVPPSMTTPLTGTNSLHVDGTTKSPTLAPSVTPSFWYETATSTTKAYATGSSTPDFPFPHGSKSTELPISKHEKSDYQTSTKSTPKPKVTHKDKPFIPVITGSLPIAPKATETKKNTAPTNDNLPSVIVPPSSDSSSASSQSNTSLMTLNVRLSWPSVVTDPNYPPILFFMLPENIADAARISPDEIGVSKVTRAPDDSCLVDFIVPTSHANKIKKLLSDSHSNFYTNGTEDEKKINNLVNSEYAIALQANSANSQAADQNFNSSPNSSSSSPIGAIVVVAVCGSTLLYAGLTALVVRAYKRSKNRASATGQDTYGTYSGQV